MKKSEVMELFKTIKQAYNNFDTGLSKMDLWAEFLKDVPADLAQENLLKHIAVEKFPPTIADLSRSFKSDPSSAFHVELRISSKQHFDQVEEWRKTAVPPPAHVKERMRQLAEGWSKARNS
ncbi:replicative helicase loader/inhibitor [Paenibacillus gansuensis]|uniref:Replicative helicase loader/inhibitor n=1 Tax=Paenibacillus gansuensis TaxID=306542 RepID=A0ABW5PIJ3_9BACL